MVVDIWCCGSCAIAAGSKSRAAGQMPPIESRVMPLEPSVVQILRIQDTPTIKPERDGLLAQCLRRFLRNLF